MRLKMAENSLFAVLLRSSWWISLVLAVVIAAASRALLPAHLWLYGAFGALPFIAIAAISARRQFRAPSARRIAATVAAVRGMSAGEFAHVLEGALRADGYEVRRLDGPGADLELRRRGRVALLAWRRWKAAHVGVEPLRALLAAAEAHDAHDRIFVAVGDVSDAARTFAARHRIQLLGGPELARLFPLRRPVYDVPPKLPRPPEPPIASTRRL